MVATTIIIVIAGALILSILVTAVAQKKEKAEQSKRLQISKIRYKANQIQDLMDWLNKFCGEPRTTCILAEVIIAYLSSILKIDPGAVNVEENINHLRDIQNNPPPRKALSRIPKNNGELNALVNKVSRIIDLILKLGQSGQVAAIKCNDAVQSLKEIYFQLLVDGHIKLGSAAFEQKQIGIAVQHFSFAQEKLDQSNLPEDYAVEKSKVISDFIATMTQSTPAEKEKQKKEKPKETEAATETENVASPFKEDKFKDTSNLGSSDSIFDQKKKW